MTIQNVLITGTSDKFFILKCLWRGINKSAKEARKMDLTVLARSSSNSRLLALESVKFEVMTNEDMHSGRYEYSMIARDLLETLEDDGYGILFDCCALILLTVGMTLVFLGTDSFLCRSRHICLAVEFPC